MRTYDIPRDGKTKTVTEWAKFLNCHPETLRRAIRNKELLATRQPLSPGRVLEVAPVDMAAFLDKRKAR